VLYLPQDFSMILMPANAQVQLSLTVDEKGLPQNVKVVKSFNPFVDARVIDTVSEMHFRPGTLDNRPTAVDLNLIINVAR
jgi:outer membrane biosynthesis protein TonB